MPTWRNYCNIETHMTTNESSPNALGTTEIYQQIQSAKLINLQAEIAKGIKDVKSGRVKKMDIYAIKKKLVHCKNELLITHC